MTFAKTHVFVNESEMAMNYVNFTLHRRGADLNITTLVGSIRISLPKQTLAVCQISSKIVEFLVFLGEV